MVRETLTLAALFGLFGCTAAQRPAPVACAPGEATIAGARAAGGATETVAAAVEAASAGRRAGIRARGDAAGQQYLVLSTGGQWGAFGAGFLAGWTGNGRPAFDIVTGVSAGALLTVPAALGPAADPVLAQFRGISNADLVRTRGLGALFGPSLYAVGGLERVVRAALDEAAVAALAGLPAQGRSALIGAVDLEQGDLRVFDLGAQAAAGREACIGTALLASSAIPAVFPPRNIDGRLYADGGLRAHVFLDGFEAGAERVLARGEDFDATLTIVVNGDLRVPDGSVDYRTLDVALRSAEIALDQGLRESIRSLLRLSRDRHWTVRAITARDVDLGACAPYETPFDGCVTRTLYDHGQALARRDPIPWLTAEELGDLVGLR